MNERKELKTIVIASMDKGVYLRASQIYQEVRESDPHLFRRENVRGFRSFCKILNMWPEVKSTVAPTKEYTVLKKV